MADVLAVLRRSALQLPINSGFWLDGTMTIGLSFIFLAYVWHPVVSGAYDRMRAYRAWRAIEKRHTVEVTTYPTLTEVFGRQGMCACDAARVIAVAWLAFNGASWGLELNMDLYALDNKAWLLTQPPPVIRDGTKKNSTWIVLALDNIQPGVAGEDVISGVLENKNIFDDHAKSYYLVEDFKEFSSRTKPEYIKGQVVVADWNPKEKPGSLSYAVDDGFTDTVTVEKVGCASDDSLKYARVQTNSSNGDRPPWGNVTECEEGPKLLNQKETTASQPAIILTKDETEETYVIVEETAEKLSFLYSVWEAANLSSVELTYSFHISSAVRMAEAVVTGIVNGELGGKECFSLLRAYSMNIDDDFAFITDQKASPFGENPESGKVDNLQEVEAIEAGVEVNNFSLTCLVLLVLLSVAGVAWSFCCLRSSVPIDVYDSEALIRAVSLQGQSSSRDLSSSKPKSAVRIFVRKEDSGSLTVVVSDAGDDKRSWLKRLLRRGGSVVETSDPAPVADTFSQYNDGFGGVAVPVGPRTVWLGGVRTGMGRAFPGREGNFQYPTSVALSASPVHSDAGGSFAGTPVALRSPPASFVPQHERRGSFRRDGRGPSAFFDSVRSVGSCENSSRSDGKGSGGSGGSGESGGSGGSGGSGARDPPTKTNSRQRGVVDDERGAVSDFFAQAAAREMT